MYNVIDNALEPEHEEPEHEEPEHEERQALKDLCKGVENLKSDIMIYSVLLKNIEYYLLRRYVLRLRSQTQ